MRLPAALAALACLGACVKSQDVLLAHDAAAADVAPDAPGPRECDLLRQDCPQKKVCYPDEAGTGATVCRFGGSAGIESPCTGQDTCDSRLICIDVGLGTPTCTALCSTEAPACRGGGTCTALAHYEPAGFCRP